MSFQDFLAQLIKAFIESLMKPKPTPIPIPTPTPTPTPIPNDLLTLHNNYRLKKQLKPLVLNSLLANAAQKHSEWMNKNGILDHNEKGKNPGDRILSEGYQWASYGENIASGYTTPQAVFQGWINSAGHRQNIENERFQDVGFGLAGKYWTTVFASKTFGATAEEIVNSSPKGLAHHGM